ncbi:DUF4123 domain-containing protein [Pseudomonas sp. C2B4]|uniref:DUF4123 domain-containing protein n=1 Tax=Pseudomonas sp. C2B4 TaxID=2735270 RepID=UPI001586BF11|nr:DUF4123 domain-containing protein [Pseudomonas sp. C2B4]NUU34984.1 DUF4123 domain-containing protein [Pseudomonas sp. C2B4]
MTHQPVQWMATQLQLGRSLCLILDSAVASGIHQTLVSQLSPEHYQSVYSRTAVASLAADGPYVFLVDSLNPSTLDESFEGLPRDWGWLASIENGALERLLEHWRERLFIGQRPQQGLYRFQDNRVLARALAHLPESAYPEYLGPVISACYWQGEQWRTVENPAPGQYPVPETPPWLDTPATASQEREILLANVGQYLLAEHSEDLARLPAKLSPRAWLAEQLDLAEQWGWQTPEQLRFLVVERLREMHTPGIKNWIPHPEEPAQAHFERLRGELQSEINTRPQAVGVN